MTLRIDGKDVRELSLDQLGATLQQLSNEVNRRGYTHMAEVIDDAGSHLRLSAMEGN